MSEKMLAILGQWTFRPDGAKGINVYSYNPETSEMQLLDHYADGTAIGQQYYDPNKSVLYAVQEVEGEPGTYGGGGYIHAFKVDKETGKLSFMNKQCTLMTKPSYFWLDKTGKFAMISCHTGRNGVTKVVRNGDGTFSSKVEFEDVGVVLMAIEEDGSLGPVCDVALYSGLTPIAGQVHSHPHSIKADPSGEIFYTCDKGLDMIYSYKIDYERRRIIRKAETDMPFGYAPRYLTFHPTLPVLYENNETSKWVYAFNYCKETGGLKLINKLEMCPEAERAMPSDIVITPDGRFVYVSVRGVNKIVCYATDSETGAISEVGTYATGSGPRGLCVSPDGRYVLSANSDDNTITTFAIGEDGSLTPTGVCTDAPTAANVGVY